MMSIFEEKAKRFHTKPDYIWAAKYEKGMENGWVIEFYNKGEEDTGNHFIIFGTENEAIEHYKNKPIYEETVSRNDEEFIVQYDVEYYEPKPCLWHNRKHVISDFGYEWEEQEYEIIEENDWIIKWEGSSNLGVYHDGFMKIEWESDEISVL